MSNGSANLGMESLPVGVPQAMGRCAGEGMRRRGSGQQKHKMLKKYLRVGRANVWALSGSRWRGRGSGL